MRRSLLLMFLISTAVWARAATVAVVVNGTEDAAVRTAGITEGSLRSIAALTLRNNRVQVGELGLVSDVLDVGVNVLDLKSVNGYAVNVNVGLYSTGVVDNSTFVRSGAKYPLVLCTQNTILAGPTYDMGTRVEQNVEQLIKRCLGKLTY